MEDEKNEKGTTGEEQNAAQKGAEAVQKTVDNTKKTVKTIKKVIDFFKAHPLLAKILFWVVLAIVIIVLFVCILYTIGIGMKEEATTTIAELSKSIATMNVSEGSGEGSGQSNVNYIESGASIDGNKYLLKYDNYTEEEKEQKVQEMKDILARRNIEIYSNQCLLFLYELKENGLDLSLYTEGELEALYMFYKADIATTSIDLRSADEIYDNEGNYNNNYLENTIVPQYTNEDGETQFGYSEESYNEDNYDDDTVYGTVRIQRMTYDSNSVGKEEGEISYLTYKPYTEFTSLIESKSSEVLNYFTIDSEYNLIVAGWSNVETTYTFTGLDEYTSEEQEAIKSEYPEDGKEGSYNVYKCRSIPYQDYISKYSLNFEFLISLLATTKDADFCKEIAKIAEKSYIVITLHEEHSITTTTTTTNYTDFEKIYATLVAECSGENTKRVSTGKTVITDLKYDKFNEFYKGFQSLLSQYHYSDASEGDRKSGFDNTTGSGYHEWIYEEEQKNIIYTLEYNTKNYTLKLNSEIFESQKLTHNRIVNDIFVTKNRTFIKNGYPTQSINSLPAISEDENTLSNSHLEALEDYTKLIEKNYTVENVTVSQNNSYKMEITEVNNWYEYYKKTYSAVESKTTESVTPEYTDELEITEENIGTRQITNSSEINKLDYIKEISTETKNNFVKTEIGEQDLTDITFTINQVDENFYKYGYATVNSNSNTNTYKKGEKITEEVQVKVQQNNDIAYLTISADAITSNNQNEDDEDNTDMIYGTSYKFTDGFLYVYDKYDTVQKTFNSIDEWTYEMLDSSGASINMTNLLKYLLFLYDGSDLGVTDYNLNLFRPDELKKNQSMLLLKQYIHMWENSSGAPTNEDGTCYIIIDDGAGNPAVGYGVDIENSGYKQMFIDAGYPTEIGGEVPIDFVDGIEEMILEQNISDVKSYVSDFDLTEYQLNALISRAYNCGAYGAIYYKYGGMSFYDAYKAYWNEEDDKFEEKDNNADFEHDLYTASMSKPVTSNGIYLSGLENRRRSEWTLFQTGYYDVLDKWHVSGGAIIQCAKYIHEYMEENSYTYCVCDGSEAADECSYYGKSHGLNTTFEKSIDGYHNTCCATFVSWVLQEAGYITEAEHTNGAHAMDTLLRNKGWIEITNPDDLEPGDILYYGYGHVEIYAGDNTVYNAGSGNAIRGSSPQAKNNISSMTRAWRAPN